MKIFERAGLLVLTGDDGKTWDKKTQGLFMRGMMALKMNELDSGINLLMEARKTIGDLPVVLTPLSHAYVMKNQYDEAVKICQLGLEKQPENISLLYNMGFAHFSAGRINEGFEAWKTAVLLGHNRCWTDIIEKAVQFNRFDEIYAFFISNETNANALRSIGYYYEKYKDYNQALSFYERALSLSPNNPHILGNIGVIYAQQQNFEKAIPMFEKAHSLDPFEHSHIQHLINSFHCTMQMQKMIDIAKIGLKNFPDDRDFQTIVEAGKKYRIV